MGVQGPLARSATDLELLFDVIAGRASAKTPAGSSRCPSRAARS